MYTFLHSVVNQFLKITLSAYLCIIYLFLERLDSKHLQTNSGGWDNPPPAPPPPWGGGQACSDHGSTVTAHMTPEHSHADTLTEWTLSSPVLCYLC